ncbi:MAG: cation transporter [Bacteroidales bacterium]|mgnify:CR=1 FL=1|nr:cation transporter [Bacteroidales bacterium]MCB9028254.1 cation transporter [Bacteroidales bacterium]NLD64479.1 cation transporter [Bacteroidales bacterium]HNT93191.1 cation diffusion facilitator family transporter [Bacteroidales bacterium]HOO66939.1 cation diffusion facilitator family transporter [Bacteroidales bacterium]
MTAIEKNRRRTGWVVILTAVTMVIEIIAGWITGSMALMADGIHMGSHVLAIGLSWAAYVLVQRLSSNPSFTGSREKILTLAGYTSGLILLIFAAMIIAGAVGRFVNPRVIEYREAIMIAFIGLGVNILSAFLLHHDHEETDKNIRAAYLHVLADAITSVAAITGLAAAMIWGLPYIDAIAALISSAVIIKWSLGLLRDAGKELIS